MCPRKEKLPFFFFPSTKLIETLYFIRLFEFSSSSSIQIPRFKFCSIFSLQSSLKPALKKIRVLCSHDMSAKKNVRASHNFGLYTKLPVKKNCEGSHDFGWSRVLTGSHELLLVHRLIIHPLAFTSLILPFVFGNKKQQNQREIISTSLKDILK